MRRRAPVLAVAGLVLAVAAACGDGASRLSQPEFTRRADAICRDFQERINLLQEPRDLDELANIAAETLPILENGLAEIRDLLPPADLEETVDEWLSAGDESVRILREIGIAARDGKRAVVIRLLQETSANDARADSLATRIGFSDCGRDTR
jgi:hypothetical protein